MAAGRAIAEWFVRIGADTSGMTTGMKQAEKSMSGLKTVIGIGAGLIASHYTTMAVKGAYELGRLGAEHDRLAHSFEQLTKSYGNNAQDMLASLKAVSKGTISDTDLMLASNRAMMLGVAEDTEHLTELMEIAAFRGRAMGLSMAQAFSDIVTGIGRASPMILDNLGIVLDAERTYKEYAESIGKAADELTAAEKKVALRQRVIAEGQAQIAAAGGPEAIGDDVLDSYERLGVSVENLKVALGELINESGSLDTIATGVDWVTERTKVWTTNIDLARQILDHIAYETLPAISANWPSAWSGGAEGGGFGAAGGAGGFRGEIPYDKYESGRVNANRQALDDLIKRQKELTEELNLYEQKQSLVGKDTSQWMLLELRIEDVRSKVKDLNAELSELLGIKLPGDALSLMPSTTGGLGAAGRLRVNPQEAEQQKEATHQLLFGNIELERRNELLRANEERQKAATRAVSDASQAYAEFSGIISSFMTPTSVTQWDVMATEAGTYVEKWDEYARRLEDVKNRGLESPWASLIGDAASDQEAKLKAQQMQRDFYDFLAPDKVDKEALKEQYRRYLEGELNKKALIRELYTELGGTASQAAEFLGVEMPETTLAGIQSGLTAEAGGAQIASTLTGALAADIDANGAGIAALGASIATHMLGGMGDEFDDATLGETLAMAIQDGIDSKTDALRLAGADAADTIRNAIDNPDVYAGMELVGGGLITSLIDGINGKLVDLSAATAGLLSGAIPATADMQGDKPAMAERDAVTMPAMGMDMPELSGDALLGGLTASIKSYELVSPLAQRLRDDLNANDGELLDAGERAGAKLLEGITKTVKDGSTTVIRTLAEAIAPDVAAILAWEDSR